MQDQFNFGKVAVENWDKGTQLLAKLLEVASPRSVFGEPVQAGEYTVITASEVSVGMGFGTGSGGGSTTQPAEGERSERSDGGGGGGGGGGGSMARPVAVISVGPGGVKVEPVVDPTKIALAFFTMLGSMWMMRRRMKKLAKG